MRFIHPGGRARAHLRACDPHTQRLIWQVRFNIMADDFDESLARLSRLLTRRGSSVRELDGMGGSQLDGVYLQVAFSRLLTRLLSPDLA